MPELCHVALLGQKFMGRAHSNAYLKASRFFNLPLVPSMHTIVGLDLISLAPFAARWGWRNYSTAWKDVVKQTDIGLVDVSTPNSMHADQALAAIAAGKHVACEKPLAHTLKDARAMRNAAVKSRRSKTFVWFNYRRCPAIALAYRIMREGRLGKVRHVRAAYLQSWGGPETPLGWRFQKKYAGFGAHGDLNSHIVDLARFLTGQEFVEIVGAVAETFVTERPAPVAPGKEPPSLPRKRNDKPMGKCDVDDCALFLAKMNGGAIAVFEATRVSSAYQNQASIEIDGEQGAIRFELEDLNHLHYFDAREPKSTAGWRRIMCTTAGEHPYAGAWWPEGHLIGYEHTFVNMVADMMAALAGESPTLPLPDFADAYETQRVLEAVMLSARHRAAVKLSEVK